MHLPSPTSSVLGASSSSRSAPPSHFRNHGKISPMLREVKLTPPPPCIGSTWVPTSTVVGGGPAGAPRVADRNRMWVIDTFSGLPKLIRRPRSRGLRRETVRSANQQRLANLAGRLVAYHGGSPMGQTRYAARSRLGVRHSTDARNVIERVSQSTWAGPTSWIEPRYPSASSSTPFWPPRRAPVSRPLY